MSVANFKLDQLHVSVASPLKKSFRFNWMGGYLICRGGLNVAMHIIILTPALK
jgi:hypothetical protein